MPSVIALIIIFIVFVITSGIAIYLIIQPNTQVGTLEQYNQWHSDGFTYTNYTVVFQNHSPMFIVFKCDYYHSGENITWNFDSSIFPVYPIPEGC